MKRLYFLSFIFVLGFMLSSAIIHSQSGNVGIGVPAPQTELHVAGTIRSDSLSGAGVRVALANANGDLHYMTAGNNNDIIHQTPQGPVWKPSNSNSVENDCPTLSCPTIFSTTSSTGDYYGACLRYCGTLNEGGFNDWRVPSIDEVTLLAPTIPAESVGIWTKTPFIYTADPSWPGSRRQVTFNLLTGDQTVVIAVNQTIYCKCVR